MIMHNVENKLTPHVMVHLWFPGISMQDKKGQKKEMNV